MHGNFANGWVDWIFKTPQTDEALAKGLVKSLAQEYQKSCQRRQQFNLGEFASLLKVNMMNR